MSLVHVTKSIILTDSYPLDELVKQLHNFSMVTMNIDSSGRYYPRVQIKGNELKLEGWRMATQFELEEDNTLFDNIDEDDFDWGMNY